MAAEPGNLRLVFDCVRRPVVLWVVARSWLALGVALTACGSPADSMPIDAGNVFDELLRPAAGGVLELDEVDAGELVDAGGELVAQVDAGELVDDAGWKVWNDAGELELGLPGVKDGGMPVEYGGGELYNARIGCLPGFLNCDGLTATGCELEVGCPVDEGAKCATCASGGTSCWCRGSACLTSPDPQRCP